MFTKECVTCLSKCTSGEIGKKKKKKVTRNVVPLPRVRKSSVHSSPYTFILRKSGFRKNSLGASEKLTWLWKNEMHVFI